MKTLARVLNYALHDAQNMYTLTVGTSNVKKLPDHEH